MPSETDTIINDAGEISETNHGQQHKTAPRQTARRGRQTPNWRKPQVLVGALAVVIAFGVGGTHYWRYAGSHVATDDAYVTTDNTIVAPQISGIVQKVLVTDNQPVKKGSLLVIMEDSSCRAAVQQARANLAMAVAQAQGAGASIDLTSATANAQIVQAQGVLEQSRGAISGAQSEQARAEAAVVNARAVASSSDADVKTAEAAAAVAAANRQRLEDSLTAAQASQEAADATYQKAVRDTERARKLVAQGAISTESAETSELAMRTAKAALAGRQADVSASRQALAAAGASLEQAKAQLSAARQHSIAARAGIRQALAQSQAALHGLSQASARRKQAEGQLLQARTAPSQVAVSRSGKAQALAKVDQARAALADALLRLSYTRIYAPVDGVVGKRSAEVGTQVQPGTPLMTVVDRSTLRITANFKETQLKGVRTGAPATVRVDALRGQTFKGYVDSLSAATGSTFALLPPDNATGNFTKVVQRVPVRITLTPGQPCLDELRSGLSAVAVVTSR